MERKMMYRQYFEEQINEPHYYFFVVDPRTKQSVHGPQGVAHDQRLARCLPAAARRELERLLPAGCLA
jgi:hypothetical protein